MQLLLLSQQSPENLDKILAHDRWKTEAILDNKLQIEEMRNRLLSTGDGGEKKTPYTKDDIDFNNYSSYFECNNTQINRIARTKVKQGAIKASQEMWGGFAAMLFSNSSYSAMPNEDKREQKLRGFLTNMICYCLCTARHKKWPDAKDKSSLLNVRQDFEEKCVDFASNSLEVLYSSFEKTWPDYFEKIEFSDISSEVEEIISASTIRAEEKERRADIKESPLFIKTASEFPTIDLDILKSYYTSMPGKYVDAAVRVLTLDFIRNRPPELSHTDEFAEWSDIYIDHLHNYKETWKNKLKEIEIDTWNAQIKWNGALTS